MNLKIWPCNSSQALRTHTNDGTIIRISLYKYQTWLNWFLMLHLDIIFLCWFYSASSLRHRWCIFPCLGRPNSQCHLRVYENHCLPHPRTVCKPTDMYIFRFRTLQLLYWTQINQEKAKNMRLLGSRPPLVLPGQIDP